MNKEKFITGPYRATKLWNDAVRSFHKGMPLSRHWRGLRQYDNCFTASEAIDWLHSHLCANPNFGPGTSREQTLKLLRKFFKSGLVIEARGNKLHPDELHDNRELLRFGNRSPLKALRTPQRVPLAPLNTNAPDGDPSTDNGASPELSTKNSLKKRHRSSTSMKNERPVTPFSTLSSQKENSFNEERDQSYSMAAFSSFPTKNEEEVWTQVLSEKLEGVSEQLMVVGDGSAPLLTPSQINPLWVKQNSLKRPCRSDVQPRGLLQTDLPSWILTAMKSLANWPNSSESICNIPNYPGVEMDIFKIVQDFFVSMVVPLIPYELYDPILRLYIGAEFLDVSYRSSPTTRPAVDGQAPKEVSLNDSVENLMLDISVNVNDIENFSQAQLLDLKKDENGTPVPNEPPENTPQTLRLGSLKAYTNFKDSLLYPPLKKQESCNSSPHIPVKSHSEERRTLKSLKNRPKSNSALAALQKRRSSGDVSREPGDPFGKLLRTEDLDTFSLPPNSCFETAFTSDSPRTRIIPQKSVDTIHLSHASGRPKSIAISSFVSDSTDLLNRFDSLERSKTLFSRARKAKTSDFLNRSLSEGNFFRVSDCSGSSSASTSVQSLKSDEKAKPNKERLKNSGSKTSLASRVRDSIKRRKEKSEAGRGKSRALKRGSSSQEALLSYANEHAELYTNTNRLRTKSGGYANPMLNFQASPSESSSVKSDYSLLNHLKSESGIGSSRSGSTPDLLDSRTSTLRSRPNTASSDTSSLLRKRRLSPMLSSTPSELSTRDCSSRCSSVGRWRPYTPTGCLSHSMTSCVSNSMYLSALSELSRSSTLSTGSRVQSPLPHPVADAPPPPAVAASILSLEGCKDTGMLEEELKPDLPSKEPLSKQGEEACAVNQLLHDYENLTVVGPLKVLSSSASDLSDPWKDRTPYGTVPPFVPGGMWHHYRASPSKRLIGQHSASGGLPDKACLPGLLTKAGKDVCIEALQYVLLLLEPLRRRKLLLLLRMMHKASANEKLQLQDGQAETRALMVKSFSRCILLSEREGEYDELLVLRIVTFLMDNHEALFAPPPHLPVLVYRRLSSLSRKVSKGAAAPAPDSNGAAFCLRVSPKTYEEQKLTGSQKFLADLLDQIVEDSQMTDREKRKRLKEFKTHYPEIYRVKFPDNVEVLPARRPPGSAPHRPRLKGLRKFTSIASFGKAKSIRI